MVIERTLVERLEAWLGDIELWRDDPSASFEASAEQFYRETGYMAPGKSVPLAMAGVQYDADRHRAHEEWTRKRWDAREALLREAIAALRDRDAELTAAEDAVARLMDVADKAEAALRAQGQGDVEAVRRDERAKTVSKLAIGWLYCPWCGKPPERHPTRLADCVRALPAPPKEDRRG